MEERCEFPQNIFTFLPKGTQPMTVSLIPHFLRRRGGGRAAIRYRPEPLAAVALPAPALLPEGSRGFLLKEEMCSWLHASG